MQNNIKHPAKFTDTLIPEMAKMLSEFNTGKVLDPFAGTGKIALMKILARCNLAKKGFHMIIYEPNTQFYDYTEEELNDFVEYKKRFQKENVNSYNRRMFK